MVKVVYKTGYKCFDNADDGDGEEEQGGDGLEKKKSENLIWIFLRKRTLEVIIL